MILILRIRVDSPLADNTFRLVTPTFLGEPGEQKTPHVFLQWKGTDVCLDFHCECGAHCHFDGDFAYALKCPHCGTLWEMPIYLYPRKAAADFSLPQKELFPDMEADGTLNHPLAE